jgi:hypothetical protein
MSLPVGTGPRGGPFVGTGPAGLAAALYPARKDRRTALIGRQASGQVGGGRRRVDLACGGVTALGQAPGIAQFLVLVAVPGINLVLMYLTLRNPSCRQR